MVFAQLSWQGGITPDQSQTATLLFDATGTPLVGSTGTIYAHTGVTINGTAWQNTVGVWANNTSQPAMVLVSGNQYKLVFNPSIKSFYGNPAGNITNINLVVRHASGSPKTVDLLIDVEAFDINLTAPLQNSTTFWTSGNVEVQAQTFAGTAGFVLRNPNKLVLDSVASASTFNISIDNPVYGQYILKSTKGLISIEKKFNIYPQGLAVSAALPTNLKDGINYNANDASKATLVLNAPGKDFVFVAGNFNNWNPGSSYAMKKDAVSGMFWLEISGLVSGNWYAFQYWVCENTPATGSPKVVRTADPFSTLVLSQFDDAEVITLNTFPGLPEYKNIAPRQEREVSVIQTGPNAYWHYNWTSTTKPNATLNRKDLVIYELLIRDFDANRTYQNLIDRFNYFKGLKINAIQLMPIMEFEGNMSWGYNPTFHLATDKRYGPPAKLKEFIDLCHQNGIAVILDLALNHVFEPSPLHRMWMLDANNDGRADGISPDNPYCNVVPRHTLNVGADLNHFREPDNLTNTYVIRTIEQWINDFKIDGFRWDLTQGFTNACSENDGNCTLGNQPDRLTKLKWYADKQWEIDPNFYVIFEHWAFGEINELNNYRLTENTPKGIQCWRRGDDQYANILKGNYANLSTISDASNYRIQGNMESHDEERVIYKAITEAGQTLGNLNKTLDRMPALGSVFFLVPGPKMIWHFAELGCNMSVNTCTNGLVGDCRLSTKPQPQWTQNWLGIANRGKIYEDWSKMIELRTKADLFKTGQFSFNLDVTGRPRLDVWTSTTGSTSLSYVMVHTNFSNDAATFPSFFPYTGTWYNMLDNSPLTVIATNQNITLPADGGYVIYGNQPNTLVSVDQLFSSIPGDELRLVCANPILNQKSVVHFKANNANDLRFTLYSINGKALFTQKPESNSGTMELKLPFSKGMYLLEMAGDIGRKLVKVLIE